MVAPADPKTLPMTIDAESWLRLTLGWLWNRGIRGADREDLEKLDAGIWADLRPRSLPGA